MVENDPLFVLFEVSNVNNFALVHGNNLKFVQKIDIIM